LELLCVAGLTDGLFKRVNPSWERMLGYPAEELKGQPFIAFVHPDDRARSLAEFAVLTNGIPTVSFETRFRCKDGSHRWLAWTATPSLESGLVYAAGHDVTERKRAEAELAAHQLYLQRMVDINEALLDASVDGIRMVDLEGRSLLANSVIEHVRNEIFKLPAYTTLQAGAAILAHRLTEPESYRATMLAILNDPECATTDEFELAAERRVFQRHTGPVHDSAGVLIGRIIVMREITAERDAARLKSDLVATVSHELRTPLTGVLGFAELLLGGDVDDETRRRYAQAIQGEAQRLTALVDDFLDLQKIEAGHFALALESFDLSEVLRHQVELYSAQSGGHRVEFAAPEERLPVVGDRNRLGQVIDNLLSNAIKYSPAGGAVTITAASRDACARVCIRDSGLGIPAAQQSQVFTRFFRVDSSDTRAIGGTGLGLALCDEIVAAHGGSVGFESAEHVGSTFWFELPSARAVAEDEPLAPLRAA
jgi:PAS domain S-box-containing protein